MGIRDYLSGIIRDETQKILAQLVEAEGRILRRVSALERKVTTGITLDRKGDEKMLQLTQDVLEQARRANTVGDSIITLVQQLVANSTIPAEDKAALTEALETMRQQNDEIEAAVLANTPQAPPAE